MPVCLNKECYLSTCVCSVSACVRVHMHASDRLIQGTRCGGTSYIIDLSLRFAHVARPGVPGGQGLVVVGGRGEGGRL